MLFERSFTTGASGTKSPVSQSQACGDQRTSSSHVLGLPCSSMGASGTRAQNMDARSSHPTANTGQSSCGQMPIAIATPQRDFRKLAGLYSGSGSTTRLSRLPQPSRPLFATLGHPLALKNQILESGLVVDEANVACLSADPKRFPYRRRA